MATIDCSWDELKRMAKEFHCAVPTLDEDELDNAWKCLSLGYLGMKDTQWQHSAAALLLIEARTHVARLLELRRFKSLKGE